MIFENNADLLTLPRNNEPGICEIWVMDWANMIDMPTKKSILKSLDINAQYISLSQIICKPNSQWLQVSNDNNGNTDLKEFPKQTGQRTSYSYQIALTQPNDSKDKGDIIRAFDNRKWIIAVKQITGTWRLLGSKEKGVDFSAALDTGDYESGFNTHSVGFAWNAGGERARYIQPSATAPSVTIGAVTSSSTDSIEESSGPATGNGSITIPITNTTNIPIGTPGTVVGYNPTTNTYTPIAPSLPVTNGTFVINVFKKLKPFTGVAVLMPNGIISNTISLIKPSSVLTDKLTGRILTDLHLNVRLTDGNV